MNILTDPPFLLLDNLSQRFQTQTGRKTIVLCLINSPRLAITPHLLSMSNLISTIIPMNLMTLWKEWLCTVMTNRRKICLKAFQQIEFFFETKTESHVQINPQRDTPFSQLATVMRREAIKGGLCQVVGLMNSHTCCPSHRRTHLWDHQMAHCKHDR